MAKPSNSQALSNRLLLLSDTSLGSYTIIGNLFLAAFQKAGWQAEQRDLAKTLRDKRAIGAIDRPCLIIQNTIGPRFKPIHNAYNIALVHHEWNRYPTVWVNLLNGFNEVWVTSSFVKTTLRKSGIRVPIKLFLPPLDVEPIPQKTKYTQNKICRFLSCGEPHFRKGFHLLMEGFLKAFPTLGTANLTIKTSPGCTWVAPRADITIVSQHMDRTSLLNFYADFDIYVSASLGEGFGLPVAEAILAGVPVVANHWGGHHSLLSIPHFFRIPHILTPQPFCSHPEYYAPGQQCAFSSPDRIAKSLRQAASSSALKRKEIAYAARRKLLQRFRWDAVREQFNLLQHDRKRTSK